MIFKKIFKKILFDEKMILEEQYLNVDLSIVNEKIFLRIKNDLRFNIFYIQKMSSKNILDQPVPKINTPILKPST